jgi:hypothetical protein
MTDELKACQSLNPLDLDNTNGGKIAAKALQTDKWPQAF